MAPARQQEDAARFTHPEPADLWAITCARTRVWERRLEHPDFATVRIGRGTVSLATPLTLDGGDDPLNQRDAHEGGWGVKGGIASRRPKPGLSRSKHGRRRILNG